MDNAHTTLFPACESLSEDVKNKVALRHYAMPQRLLASRAVFLVEGSTACKQARSREKSLEKRIRWLDVRFLERQRGSRERALESCVVVVLVEESRNELEAWAWRREFVPPQTRLAGQNAFFPPPSTTFCLHIRQAT